MPGLVLGGLEGAQQEVRRVETAQGWPGKVLILVLSGALFWGGCAWDCPTGLMGTVPGTHGRGDPPRVPGETTGAPSAPGTCHPSSLGAEEMLPPPASWQGSVQEALNSSHFFPVG